LTKTLSVDTNTKNR